MGPVMASQMLTISIIALLLLSHCKSNPLSSVQKEDIAYFNSYLYQFDYDEIINQNNILIDATNFKLELINSSFIINNEIQLNWNNDQHWNEISYVLDSFIVNSNHLDTISDITETANISQYEELDYNMTDNRRLLDFDDYTSWNKFDHTTQHHIKSGRFIGESKYRRKYRDARAMCHEYYAELASIRSPAENQQVQALCKKLGKGACYIGLRRNTRTKQWKDTKKWLDKHPVGYTNWAPGEPNDVRGHEGCAEMYNNGQWNDLPCRHRRYAICEKVDTHRVGEYIGVYKKASWFKGNLYCKMKYGSELATITSYWQQQDAQEACDSAKDEFKSLDCWIGLRKKQNLIWTWVDHAILSYKNWGLGMPQNRFSKKCTFLSNTMHSKSGVWQNDRCGKKKWIICNAKERTQTIQLRDMLFPPTYQEEREKQELVKNTERAELAERKQEKTLADWIRHFNQEKLQTAGEDKDELKWDTPHHFRYGVQPRSMPIILRSPGSETKNELSLIKQTPSQKRPKIRRSGPRRKPPNNQKYKGLERRIKTLEKKLNTLHAMHNAPNIPNAPITPNAPNTPNAPQLQSGLNLNQKTDGKLAGDLLNNILEGVVTKKKGVDGSFDTKGYNPHIDPYFGPMNLEHMKKKNDMKGGDKKTHYNPQFYPKTQLPHPYASAAHYVEGRRRLLSNVMEYKQIEKCMFDIKFKFCISYDLKRDMITFDVMMRDETRSSKDDYHLIQLDDIHYFEKFEILFEFNPYKESHELCAKDVISDLNICLNKVENNDIVLQVEMERFHFENDIEWNEIYANINKKCVKLTVGELCVMSIVDNTDYLVEIKVDSSIKP